MEEVQSEAMLVRLEALRRWLAERCLLSMQVHLEKVSLPKDEDDLISGWVHVPRGFAAPRRTKIRGDGHLEPREEATCQVDRRVQ